jgi:predicted enzyme related to lactoylglutathione lyase
LGWFYFTEVPLGASGTLVYNETYIPSETDGVLIYFSSADVNNELHSVEASSGKMIQTKTQISPDIGYMALFIDSEGTGFQDIIELKTDWVYFC